MSRLNLISGLTFGLTALAALACDDSAGPGASKVADASTRADVLNDSGADANTVEGPDTTRPISLGDAETPEPEDAALSILDLTSADATRPEVGSIEVALDPRRSLYALDSEARALATVKDRRGQIVGGADLEWRVDPPEAGLVNSSGNLTFLSEGQGFVRACALGGEPCGEAAFFVDAGPPKLTLTSPERGAALGGDRSDTISVRGSAQDGGEHLVVRVDGIVVGVEDDGAFGLDVPARFGINHVEVTADDGVRRPAVKATRNVMWASRWLRVGADRATVPGAASLTLGQRLLDPDAPLPFDPLAVEGDIEVEALDQLLTVVLALADARSLLGDFDLGGVGLEILDLSLGIPEIDLLVVPGGLELFLRIPELTLVTAGGLEFEGERLGLDGTLSVSLAAYAHVELTVVNGRLDVAVSASAVTIESITSRLVDPGAQALIASVGSRLRQTLEGLTSGVVGEVIDVQVPALLRTGLDGLLGALALVPIDLATGIDGAPPVSLTLSMEPDAVDPRRHTGLGVELGAVVLQQAPVRAPHPLPGVPALEDKPAPIDPETPLTLAFRLELLNALLHEVWRAGLLQLSPALPPELAPLLGAVLVDGHFPPLIVPTLPGSAFPLEAQIGELYVSLGQPGAERVDRYVLDVRAGLTLVVDAEGTLRISTEAEPRVAAELIEQAGAAPVLSADALAGVFSAIVWPSVRDALAGGLALQIPTVDVDPAAIQEFAPRLSALALAPTFSPNLRVIDGWALLEGHIVIRLQLEPL